MHSSFSLVRALAFGLICQFALPLALPAQDDVAGDESSAAWSLDVKYEALRMFSPRRGAFRGKVYWYLVYTIENNSDEDREFFLSITATSDGGRTYSDILLPPVERAIEIKLGKELWGQTDKFEVLRRRDPKEEEKYNYTTIKAKEKRQCIAVFNRLDPNANKIAIRIVGLSSDIEVVKQDDGTTLLKEPMRVLHFERSGDEYGIDQDSFRLIKQEWAKKTTALKSVASAGGGGS